MQEQYDFSNAVRGKFYNPKSDFHFPIYLEADVEQFMSRIAEEKGVEIQLLINQWLRYNIQLLQTVS